MVDVHTEEGIVGRSYIFTYRNSGARAIDAIFVNGVVRMALSALDMALWDAQAHAAKLPLAALLGGSVRPLQGYNSCGLGLKENAEAVADEAEKLLADGFNAVKLRLGYATLAQNINAVRAVRKHVGSDVKIMVDYNQALNLHDALIRGRALDDEGIYWLEEPIRHDDIQSHAVLTRSIKTPIQIGENFNSALVMQHNLQAGACSLVMPDIARIGGVTGWLQAAGVAASYGVPISSHLMPEVSAHALAASAGNHWLEWVDWANVLLQEPIQLKEGLAHFSDKPGSGIVWDQAAVERFRMA